MLAVAMLGLLAAACNGGGGDGGDEGDVDDVDDVDDVAALQDLRALAGRAAAGLTARVTYDVTSEADGETFEVEWVVVRRPPDSRVEFSSTGGAEATRVIIISASGNTYLCTSAGGEEICLITGTEAVEGQTVPLSALFDLPQQIAEDVSAVVIVDRSEREIAGLDATCFEVDSELAGLGKGEVCFSDEGLLLFLEGEVDGASSTFEATSVSTDVTDADFEPPYEVQAFEPPDFEIPTPP